ncbi:MAG: hypothetical protein J7576_20350 [Siphonobacter aquaeclarae]|nr:hypothetical protein [Siphonobacter aquaeclarae]
MRPSFSSVRRQLLTASAICLSWTLSGQSTRISLPVRADSVQLIREYIENARSVLDSLNRYEFTKARYSLVVEQFAKSQAEQLGLRAENRELMRRNDELSAALTAAQLSRDDERRRRRSAQIENWIWRAAGAAAVYLLVR